MDGHWRSLAIFYAPITHKILQKMQLRGSVEVIDATDLPAAEVIVVGSSSSLRSILAHLSHRG